MWDNDGAVSGEGGFGGERKTSEKQGCDQRQKLKSKINKRAGETSPLQLALDDVDQEEGGGGDEGGGWDGEDPGPDDASGDAPADGGETV